MCSVPARSLYTVMSLYMKYTSYIAVSARYFCYYTLRVESIGVDLAGILRGTHGARRRLVGAEWGGVW